MKGNRYTETKMQKIIRVGFSAIDQKIDNACVKPDRLAEDLDFRVARYEETIEVNHNRNLREMGYKAPVFDSPFGRYWSLLSSRGNISIDHLLDSNRLMRSGKAAEVKIRAAQEMMNNLYKINI